MLKLYNSLSRKVEEFKPINPPKVGMYSCGPTVYDFAHIGNFRSYATADLLVRVLKYNNFNVNFVMNITDVGHLVSDEDTGEDKMEKSAKKEGKTAWEVAKFYTDAFLKDYESLNYLSPSRLTKATDHIQEQIALIKRLEEQGYTYIISDGVYFDTSKFKDYGKLSTLDKIKEGMSRVEVNPEKRNPRDFALWKFSPATGSGLPKRQMEWKSPWGKGFPGWHIECSAMSMKYLGETLDIHTGGVDHISVHHANEIAQSEAATHKKFVNYWVHTAFMLVAGQKMSKSLGNIYRIYDLEKEGHEPLALRYLYMQTHYRQEMNFTFASLTAAENALKKLYEEVASWDEPAIGCAEFEGRFLEAVNDDLNMSKALSVVWELVKSDYPTSAKAESLFKMDQVLGFNFESISNKLKRESGIVPEDIKKLLADRESLRREKRFNAADQIRAKIEKMGYEIEDSATGAKVKKII
ncbi:MAG TPA: cysteine--tRNA ligase [Patescibacteria group bacterium]